MSGGDDVIDFEERLVQLRGEQVAEVLVGCLHGLFGERWMDFHDTILAELFDAGLAATEKRRPLVPNDPESLRELLSGVDDATRVAVVQLGLLLVRAAIADGKIAMAELYPEAEARRLRRVTTGLTKWSPDT